MNKTKYNFYISLTFFVNLLIMTVMKINMIEKKINGEINSIKTLHLKGVNIFAEIFKLYQFIE